jgi:hypothetical protein
MGSNRDVWKSQDRVCPPCANCGAELYKAFWGNGGWVKTEKAPDRMHGSSCCVKRMAAELQRMRVQLGGLKGWCERNGHDYALKMVLAALGPDSKTTG